MLAKTIFHLLSSASFAFFGESAIFQTATPAFDSYPNRGTLSLNAQQICEGFQKDSAYASNDLKLDLRRLFNASVTSMKVTGDDSGGSIDAVLASFPAMHINIVYNGSKPTNFTFTVKRPFEEIEPVSRVSLGKNCSLFQAYSTYYNQQQRPHLRIRTDANGKEIFRIKMEESPNPTKASADGFLKVGFIDSGLDYNHAAVADKSRPLVGIDLTNPARPPYDYTNTIQNELMGKSYAHGTAVADVATRGLDVHIVPVRIENKSFLSGKAVEYLAQQGVRLVNISQGSWREHDWVDFRNAALTHPEMLFIVSAGNESTNIDESPTYPAGFEIPNMIVVASINAEGEFSKSFSNFGPKHVHVAAFGERVVAAQAGGGTSTVSGTSFAAPQVTRLAAKFLLNQRSLSTEELKSMIFRSARPTPQLEDKVKFGVIDTF